MKFIFTCGGTAGHINPAIAVAGVLRRIMPDCEILFIGAEGKMETDLVPREGYNIKTVKITNISRGHSLEDIKHNLDTLKNVALSTHEAKKIIRDFQPDAVIGTGGYVCFPVLKAAHELHIPTAVHESNAEPGLTTKLLADFVDRVMVGFEESIDHYRNSDKVVVTGTPVRGAFNAYTKADAKKELGMGEGEKLVVSVWGSLGAGHMNKILTQMIPLMSESNFSLIHSTGGAYYKNVEKTLAEIAPDYNKDKIQVREYIYDMPRVMAAADAVMCRAGASTIAELTYMGKPVIMVPSPNVTNNHQEKNARVLERAGGAKVMLEGEFTPKSLFTELNSLLSDEKRLDEMSRAMHSLAVMNAAEKIAEIILELVQ